MRDETAMEAEEISTGATPQQPQPGPSSHAHPG